MGVCNVHYHDHLHCLKLNSELCTALSWVYRKGVMGLHTCRSTADALINLTINL